MKIKLSKSQWEEVGNKAGWKKAQVIPSDGYADGGAPYTDEEMDLMEKQNSTRFEDKELLSNAWLALSDLNDKYGPMPKVQWLLKKIHDNINR